MAVSPQTGFVGQPKQAPAEDGKKGSRGSFRLYESLDLSKLKVRVDSEDGALRRVLVHGPGFLTWRYGAQDKGKKGFGEEPINGNESKYPPPPKELQEAEHGQMVKALLSEGVEVEMMIPKPYLPEAIYQRDSVCVIGDKVFVSKFRDEVRRREVARFSGALDPWREQDQIEFGDVLVFKDMVLVGMGARSNQFAVETLRRIITDKEVVGVPLLSDTLHLDYVTTVGGRGAMRTMIVSPGNYRNPGMVKVLQNRLGVRKENVIKVPMGKVDEGCSNVFFINPETVLSTRPNVEVNQKLREIGFKVIPVPFEGILRGMGGTRCCTAPLERED